MKKIASLILLMTFSLIKAQTITFNGCPSLFDNQNYVFNLTGTDTTGRNIYITTPIDGQPCGGLGTCEFKIQWSITNNRWEFLADEGNGTFTSPYIIYSNNIASSPKPPSLSLGTWAENTTITSGACGGALTTSNTTFTGDVQNTLLNNTEFAINNPILVYPNPANNLLYIQNSSSNNAVSIWNLQGQKVLQFLNTNVLDVSTLQTGMYIAYIETENGVQPLNFVKK